MAQFNFLDANGLNYYHGLISQYIDAADALSIKYLTFTPTGNTGTAPASISFWKVDPTTAGAQPAYTVTLPFDEYIEKITGTHTNEVAIITADGQLTYSGLLYSDIIRKSSDSGATFTAGQVAAFDSTGNAVKGLTLADVATSGDAEDVSFTPGTTGLTSTDVQGALEELAASTGGGVASKTVYITETAGGSADPYSKRYGIYQGANGSSASPVPAEKLTDIDIPKDMVVEDGSVVEIFFDDSDNTLHEGSISGPDVTEAIVGPSGTATAADAGKYIKLVVANTTSTALYIKATDLVDIYTGGTTADGTIAISASNEITFTLSQSVHGSLTLADNSVQKGWSSTAPTSGNIMAFGANGVAVDGGIAVSSINTDTFAPISNATIDAIVNGTYTPTT